MLLLSNPHCRNLLVAIRLSGRNYYYFFLKEFRLFSYFAMTSTLVKNLEKIQITQSMLDNLEYDAEPEINSKMEPITASETLGMLVFSNSDLEAAAYYVGKSMEEPLYTGGIKSIFVQESVADKFATKLAKNMKPFSKEAVEKLKLSNALEKSNEIIAKLNPKTIRPEVVGDAEAPIIVCDIPEDYFTDDALPRVTFLYTFRTVKEAIALCQKSKKVQGVSIWCENHATVYEVIAGTTLTNYYLNCCNVAWDPIQEYIDKKQPFVQIEKSYHYETLLASGVQKNVVFPFGVTFAN